MSKLPKLCRECKHKMVNEYCITSKKSVNDWLYKCSYFEPKETTRPEKPTMRIPAGQTMLDCPDCKIVKMCECWNTCLLSRIFDCSGRSEELEDRCNADYEGKKEIKTICVPETEIINFFGSIPIYPHADGNAFEKEVIE